MAVYAGTRVIKDGLVLQLDAANAKNSILDSVEYLIVGGGGGGASRHGGGGGGGGVLQGRIAVSNQIYNIVVGEGGAGASPNSQSVGSKGGNSSALGLTAFGGGAGGGESVTNSLQNGASGGGSRGNSAATGGSGILGQGFNGGDGTLQLIENFGLGGGGGGAGGRGYSANDSLRGRGGPGVLSPISGILTFYGGGGGGGGSNPPSVSQLNIGGIGGGGNGNSGSSDNATAGTNGTGGGGGGGGHADAVNWNGKAGGSGIVIIRYPGPQRATGGVVTRVGADTVHTFTTVGTSTFTVLPAYANAQAFTAAADFSNSGNIGTAVNGPTYSSGDGGCWVFDGVNDSINISDSQLLNLSTINFTVIAWLKSQNLTQIGTILSKRNPNSPFDQFIFTIGDSGTDTGWTTVASKKLLFVLRSSGSNQIRAVTSNDIINDANGNWIQNVLIRDSGTLKYYYNGIEKPLLTRRIDGAGVNSDITVSGQELFIGNANYSGAALTGNISQVQIYNRALTAQEIQQNFEATRGRYGI